MKPISIRFKCFGPYMDEQFIDFTQLKKQGLFLICGETGSGKTTVLDAMCYALYGRSSGGLRGDLEVMRCKLAQKTDETLVEFVFDCGGNRYQFTRSLKYGRKNLNDSHNAMIFRDGTFVPLMANPKATAVNKKAEELIGLTCDQFRQVVILPQGKFEQLLVSDSAEKEKILVSLFRADRWDKIAKELHRRVGEQSDALKQEQLKIRAKLEEYNCSSLEELGIKQQEDTLALAQLRETLDRAEKEHRTNKNQYTDALLADRDFQELDAREKFLASLLPRVEENQREAQLLEHARKAEAIRPGYEAYLRARQTAAEAEAALTRAAKKSTTARLQAEQAEQTLAHHREDQPQQDGRLRRLSLMEASEGVYRQLDLTRADAAEKKEGLRGADEALTLAQKGYETEKQSWETAAQAHLGAVEEYDRVYRAYLTGIGGILAEKLKEGDPCPVCGSTLHPTPARREGDHVSDRDLEKGEKARDRTQKEERAAKKKLDEAQAGLDKAKELRQEAARQEIAARTAYEAALQQKLPGIETLKELTQSIKALKQEIDGFISKEQKLTQAHTAAQSALQTAQALEREAAAKAEQAKEGVEKLETDWRQALTHSGLEEEQRFLDACIDPEEAHRRSEALIQFHTDLQRARQALAEQECLLKDRVRPDIVLLKETFDKSDLLREELSGQFRVAERLLNKLEQDARQLKIRTERHDKARVKVDEDLAFALRLNGRSGVSLQRYVLGVMLTSITVAANRLLKNVHGGRYQLYRTDEVAGSGHKSGLELEVLDTLQNERRSVTTLSGGEKFLVALSLAIGLSTVVQAQGSGVRLEAMFVDEGFGSLDPSSIQDALEVLDHIQKGAGLVGIISHVEQLAETIPTKIRILKGEKGSRCKVTF